MAKVMGKAKVMAKVMGKVKVMAKVMAMSKVKVMVKAKAMQNDALETPRSHDRRRSRLRTALLVGVSALAVACGMGGRSMAPQELAAMIEAGDAPFILDVRGPKEHQFGRIPGSTNIPHDELGERLTELPEDRQTMIVVHCQSGERSAQAEEVLAAAGYTNVYDLTGHWVIWVRDGLPREGLRVGK